MSLLVQSIKYHFLQADSRSKDVSNTKDQSILRLGAGVGDSVLLGGTNLGGHFCDVLVVERKSVRKEKRVNGTAGRSSPKAQAQGGRPQCERAKKTEARG